MDFAPRLPTEDELKEYGLSSFLVTDRGTKAYNCLGFCLGRRISIGFNDPLEELHGYGFRAGRLPPGGGNTTIVLYGEANQTHVAKLIIEDADGAWYESKCGPGLRIVHRLASPWPGYGSTRGYYCVGDAALQATVRRLEAHAESSPEWGTEAPFATVLDSMQVHTGALPTILRWVERAAVQGAQINWHRELFRLAEEFLRADQPDRQRLIVSVESALRSAEGRVDHSGLSAWAVLAGIDAAVAARMLNQANS